MDQQHEKKHKAMDVCAQSDAAAAKEEDGKNQAGTAAKAERDTCAQSNAAAARERDDENHAGTSASNDQVTTVEK